MILAWLCRFSHKYLLKSLPDYFQNLIFTRQFRYKTKHSDDLTPMKVNHVFATPIYFSQYSQCN